MRRQKVVVRKQRVLRPANCESCFKESPKSLVTLPWSPSTHWMYPKKLKTAALYLLMVGRHPSNPFSRLGKDIWLIIMKHVLIPNYLFNDCRKAEDPYCDSCMKQLYLLPPCLYCDEKSILSSHVFPDITYEIINGEFKEKPALCLKCRSRLYICELHKGKPPVSLCYQCKNPRNYADAFESSFWINLRLSSSK